LSLKHDNYIKVRKNVTIFLGEEIKMRLTLLQRPGTLVCDAMILLKKRITKQSQSQKQPPKREKTMSTFDEKQGLIQNASIENPDFYFKGSVLAIGGTPKDCFFCNLSTPVDANLLTQKLQKHLAKTSKTFRR